jgi:hypothetical protein
VLPEPLGGKLINLSSSGTNSRHPEGNTSKQAAAFALGKLAKKQMTIISVRNIIYKRLASLE